MRYFSGNPISCYSKIRFEDKPATKENIKDGGEGMGPVLGDNINASYAFENGAFATFGSHKAKFGSGSRFGLHIYGSKGVVHVATGGLGSAWFLDNPSWSPIKGKVQWQEITSEGVGKVEPIKDGGLGMGNTWIVKDLIEAIEKDRQPLGSAYDGRDALEMIMAVYESFRVGGVVSLPLKNRKHPLTMV
jgi:predicted dehydrogenase